MAKVTIDIPWGKDKEKETIFEVISALNLNDEPSLAVSIFNHLIFIICYIDKYNYILIILSVNFEQIVESFCLN